LLAGALLTARQSEAYQVTNNISQNGINFLKNVNEGGFRPKPYPDAGGYSIAYGHFILPGEKYTEITKERGEELLKNDLKIAESAVKSYVNVPLNQNQ